MIWLLEDQDEPEIYELPGWELPASRPGADLNAISKLATGERLVSPPGVRRL